MESGGAQMNICFPISIVVFFQCTLVAASDLRPFLKNEKIGVILKELNFPKTLPKDLVSGLSNKVFFLFELSDDSKFRSQRVVNLSVKYDLWDENFKVHVRVGEGDSFSRKFDSLKEVLTFMGNLRIADLWSIKDLSKSSVLILKLDALLNPIEEEQMEQIRKWVASNSVSSPLDPTGLGSAKIVAPARLNKLFSEIFNRYSGGSNIASVWQQTVFAKPFRLPQVANEE